jgi:hypothetical protein
MSLVTDIEPQRHPYLGNVVTDDPAGAGDAVYSSQAERLNSSVYNGAPFSLLSFPLDNAFQIGGVQSTYSKWPQPVPDYGLPYRFTLKGQATVYVAAPQDQQLAWLAEQGFSSTGRTMELGQWGWPYRYRNRPPQTVHTFELFAKDFPAGEVSLGENPERGLPYVVFVQPALLLYENFHRSTIGQAPDGWRVATGSGRVRVVDNLDYPGEMRPTVFDLATVPRYRPLDLRSLELQSAAGASEAATAENRLRRPAAGDFVLDVRVKLGQSDSPSQFSILDAAGQPAVTVRFKAGGQIAAVAPSGGETAVADYAPRRWYNLSLDVSPARRQYRLTVQDDQINAIVRDGLEFEAETREPLAALRLVHGGQEGDADGWVRYDALGVYER